MLAEGKDELTCDLADTYQIYNMKAYPVSFIATLAVGLKDSSRIKMKMANQKLTLEESLLAITFDKINALYWSFTEDGMKNRNRPQSVYDYLAGIHQNNDHNTVQGFNTPEEFETKRREIMKNG